MVRGSVTEPVGRHTLCAVLAGMVSSASPPTRSSHQVATATASHRRAARAGLSMGVCCHCHPRALGALDALRTVHAKKENKRGQLTILGCWTFIDYTHLTIIDGD